MKLFEPLPLLPSLSEAKLEVRAEYEVESDPLDVEEEEEDDDNDLEGLEALSVLAECAILSKALGHGVVYTLSSNVTGLRGSYWSSQEAEINPSCYVKAASTDDVSIAASILSNIHGYSEQANDCKLAIKGGGHTPWAGAANIEGGVMIDLSAMNTVSVSSDRAITSVGAGANWFSVYSYLDTLNLAVVGGRVATVGVGGLTLGGGISFYSGRFGLVCDNVVNYEVVLPHGKIVNANANSHPDLFLALKGGSNNFGIVTRFDFKTFASGPFWGGNIYYPITTTKEQTNAFTSFVASPDYDPYAALIHSYAYTSESQSWIVVNNHQYTKVPTVSSPAAFSDFLRIEPQLFNTTRVATYSDFTAEFDLESPAGRRNIFRTSTFVNSAAYMSVYLDIANSTVQPIRNVAGLVWSLTFQPLPPAITSKSEGHDVLGLSPHDGALIIALVTATWNKTSDDATVTAAVKSLGARADAKAVEMGVENRFVYLNYAARWQDPIGGYGPASKAFLQRVSREYDPDGIFQNRVPGGFKLWAREGSS